MKTTIIYLGILATMFVNTAVANGIAKENQNQNFDQDATVSSLDSGVNFVEITFKKPVITSEIEVSLSDLVSNQTKSIEEIIEEDKKITDYNYKEYQLLFIDRTIEEVINEDNQIIENTLTNEEYPLNFELIKKYENALKSEEFKNAAFDKSALKS